VLSAVVGAVVATGVSAALLGTDDDSSGDETSTTDSLGDPASTGSLGAPYDSTDIHAILDKVQESVVTITTTGEGFSGLQEGAGTGVILSDDGLILTNAHVIGDLNEIEVKLFDGSEHSASLVGSSPDDDLAVIRIEDAEDLVPAELGESADLTVGDPVIAIGNALNLGGEPTVTQGIVSAQDRSISGPDPLTGRTVQLENLIQTDAAINPGNSGGPLVNADGQVVGINTAIISDSQNIGFAIAIDPVRSLVDDLRSGEGEITPDMAFLGVSTQSVEDLLPELVDQFGITADTGAMVAEVTADSAADEAGFQEGDVVLAADGESIEQSIDLVEFVREHQPDDEVTFTIERQGEEETLNATLGERGG
jgi:S1-C subfamily serine protease